jgi:hypothetical protein
MTGLTDDSANIKHAAELRRASDEFMQRLDRLHELESRKRELPPSEPEFIRLAREVEDLAQALLHTSGQQLELAEEVGDAAKTSDGVVDLPIRESPPKRDAVAILADWRAAERRLAAAAAGSADEREARADAEKLRDEYRRITAPTPGDGTR